MFKHKKSRYSMDQSMPLLNELFLHTKTQSSQVHNNSCRILFRLTGATLATTGIMDE
jgi:hypothetical protein